MCDCGGNDWFRHLWDYYYADTHGIIFVVDISEQRKLEESGHELISLLNNQSLNGKPILIFANKNDKQSALNID